MSLSKIIAPRKIFRPTSKRIGIDLKGFWTIPTATLEIPHNSKGRSLEFTQCVFRQDQVSEIGSESLSGEKVTACPLCRCEPDLGAMWCFAYERSRP